MTRVCNRDQNIDTGKEMLMLIITEDNKGLVWGYRVKTKKLGVL